ncbi:PREDICTED: uncharacterized protein LOC104586387 isoform X2 [Nelumbo nucifera]|uniref:Uncharacterized protein LOC104586387 isoform X2 n=1 Tax=Nelumbo nucifera TaxID=4432 RepID=A0A1U7YVL0_NELNU|nr:PREDICTED: uncharacterized protein LOC104586387 isoform X2 [Nelumbo nucifera]
MASLTIPSSPNSFQLRFGSRCGKSRALFVRTHSRTVYRPIRSSADTGNVADRDGKERSLPNNSWMNSNSSAETFSGWLGSDSSSEQGKRGFGGIVGAGVAGIVLAAGVTFASLSLSRRNTSAIKQQMEPLKVEQQEQLASSDQNEKVELGKNAENTMVPDEEIQQKDCNPERETVPTIPVPSSDKVSRSGVVDDGSSDAPNFKGTGDDPAADPTESNIELQVQTVAANLVNPSVSCIDATNVNSNQDGISSSEIENSEVPFDFSGSTNQIPIESLALDNSVNSESYVILDPQPESKNVIESANLLTNEENLNPSKMLEASSEFISSPIEVCLNENRSSGSTVPSVSSDQYASEPDTNGSRTLYESPIPGRSFSSAGIPAPSLVSAALQVPPGKVLIPAVVDQVQGQALAALQVLKVIESDVQPGDLCTRREYARWLVSASCALSRNTVSKVYPAMYIENVTELAFDDITPEDPDFALIQGLAEAGLISSKLSRQDMFSSPNEEQKPFLFSPESPLSRQDLVSWKMALEKRLLPEVDRKVLYQQSGFIDIDKINPDAWPAILADLANGEQGIITLALGYTRLFQPDKPVTKAQAAIALATGDAADIVSEELARIEAESMAETAVAAHNALVAQVEKDVNANFEKELAMEREKIDAVEKLAEEARLELERLRAEREQENDALVKGRAAIESEMEVLSRLRHEVEEQLQSLMSNQLEISFERERINKLRKETESENQAIARLQYELEVERKALSMARAWAEDEAKRAREQAKTLEEARERWERQGIKVVVDSDLQDDASAGVTWLNAGKQSVVSGTVNRAEVLVGKLKALAGEIGGKSKLVVEKIIEKIVSLISVLKEWSTDSARQVRELQSAVVSKASESVQELQQSTTQFGITLKEGTRRIAEDCREGVEKLTQRFKT